MHVEELEIDESILHLTGVFVMQHNCANEPANNFLPTDINVLFTFICLRVTLKKKACQKHHTKNREQTELSDGIFVEHVWNTGVLHWRLLLFFLSRNLI